MTPIEQSTLDSHFEQEKKQSELFSEKDLIEFTTLVKDKEDFAVLLKGLSNKNILTEINNKGGLKTTIDKKIGETDKEKGLKILSTTTNFDKDQDLYEICILGAILKNEKDKLPNPNYKKLAKEYYESVWGTSTPEVKETAKETNIKGTYETAKANIADKTNTEIKETTTIVAGEKITAASVSISAGADMRSWKDNEKAKTIYTSKIAELKTTGAKFTAKNKAEVNKIITELEDTKKIGAISTDKKDNQEGNRYLIGARIAEGFIKALDNLALDPEPTLTLTVDWNNCTIGNTNSDIEDDRFVKIKINVTKENSIAGEKEQAGTGKINTDKTNTAGTQTGNTKPNSTVTPATGGKKQGEKVIIPGKVVPGEKGPEGQGTEKPNANKEIKESAETLQVKHDIADHFKLQGQEFATQEVSDLVQDAKNKNSYTATIKGYTDFSINYVGDTIEIAQGTVKKGLIKRDIKEKQSVKVDRVNKDRNTIKKDLVLVFNATESKKYINSKLLSTTTGDQGKYEVKEDKDVTENTVKIEYTNNKVLKPIQAGEAISDKITISLDSEYMVNKGKDTSIPMERQKIEGETEKTNCNKPYRIDDNTKKISYYAKTAGGTKDPTIHIINNVTKVEEDTSSNITETPIFTEYTNIIKQNRTLEEYTKKIMLSYDTPSTTSIEKQFQNTASVEYADQKYSITTTFDIPGKRALKLTLPITYKEGSTNNQNTSSITYDKTPTLSWTDQYNKVEEGHLMIDGMVYYIGVANQLQNNMPTIIFRHVEDKTLANAKERTKDYKIESNIFGMKTANDKTQEGYINVNTGFGNCEYGPLTIKDGNWADPISYYKDIYVGQVKDENRILLQGTKVGSMYFDQHGKFLEYKTNEQQMTFDKQTDKVDLKDNTPIGIKEPLGKKGKNVLLTQSLIGTTLNVDIMDPEDTYVGTKTGIDFVKTQDEEKAKNIDEYFSTSRETKLMVAKNRILIYEGLKKISSDDVNEKSQNLFNFITEENKEPNVVLGPDWKGVYAYKLIKADKEYPAQYIYCKVNNNKIALCNADGNILEQQKIFLKSNKDYYNIKLNDEETEFKITGKEKEAQTKVPQIESDIDKEYKAYTGDLTQDRYCGYRSTTGEEENSYQFMCGKYTSFEVDVNDDTIEGRDKIDDLSTFSLVDENQEGFGSYKDFFTTQYQENLGIDEKIYKEVFSTVLQEKETNTENLVRVKYEKNGKFYYAPMYLDINKRGEKNIFDMSISKGWKDAIKETEKRLNNLVKSYSIFLEQDITTDKTKGDILQGWYLVKPTSQSANEYFKDPTQNINLSLQTNNKIGGEYQKETIIFDPRRESIEPTEITFSGITYGLTIKMDSKMGYKIIVKKGEVTEE